MFKPARILVPTDLSEHSFKAIRQAFDIAQQFNSEVFILHVIRDPVQECSYDFCLSSDLANKLQAEMDESVRKGIKQQLANLPSIDPDKIITDVKSGNPYKEILKEAEEREIDLIVIPPLGSTGLAQFMIGSVARNVLLGAKCAVLLSK
jgi:nucleotide-binding universal stress UspA family protein